MSSPGKVSSSMNSALGPLASKLFDRVGDVSFAHVSFNSPLAFFTGHVAAPVVFAVAPLHHFVHVRVVASATAHQIAAVAAVGGFVALPGIKEMGELVQIITKPVEKRSDRLCLQLWLGLCGCARTDLQQG